MTLLPYQLRIVDEHNALAEKLKKLEEFHRHLVFAGLPDEERSLLTRQAHAMSEYLHILKQRMARFPKPEEKPNDA